GRLVGSPAPVRAVRPHRLLRLVSGPARDRALPRDRPPAGPQLRAGRGLVLGLPHERAAGGPRPARTPAPAARPGGPRPRGAGPGGLARSHPLAAPPPRWGGSSAWNPFGSECSAPRASPPTPSSPPRS